MRLKPFIDELKYIQALYSVYDGKILSNLVLKNVYNFTKANNDVLFAENQDLILGSLIRPGYPPHPCFNLYTFSDLKLVCPITHAQFIKSGGKIFQTDLFEYNKALIIKNQASDFISIENHDYRPSFCIYSFINSNNIISNIKFKIVDSLGLNNNHEQSNVWSKINIDFKLKYMSKKGMDKSFLIPLQDSRKGNFIDLNESLFLKKTYPELKNWLDSLNNRVIIFDSEVSIVDRITYLKFVSNVNKKVDISWYVNDEGDWDDTFTTDSSLCELLDFSWLL